jgi:hypothetical protein
MLLIYTHIITPRLQYICHFIFNEQMGLAHELTTDEAAFNHFDDVKINYSLQSMETGYQLEPLNLLFENTIATQQIDCFLHNSNKVFFKTSSGHFAFDIFAASFYLLSRYEEYLPHNKDKFGRYAHENSLAFKEDFIHLPLINIWVNDFIISLQQHYPALKPQLPSFQFQPTYDIDIAFSYQHKGWIRNIGGFIRQPSSERLKVLLGWQQDPFDCFDWLQQLHETKKLSPIYFFLVAEKNGLYDKNILPTKPAMQALIKKHAAKYTIGIHPSWRSGDEKGLLLKEKKMLEQITGQPVVASRQHFIRFNLPDGYQRLMEAGISADYSMGYGSINGFRASVASSFYWYNLQKEETTSLRIHPFCFMEANSFYQQHFTPAQALEEMMHYYQVCKHANGTFISIWHNHTLGTDKLFEGWRVVYEQFIDSFVIF